MSAWPRRPTSKSVVGVMEVIVPSLHSLIAALVISVAPALAEPTKVQVAMHDGLVSVIARDAMLGEILDAWGRVGQTKIINAEKVVGPPLTIQFADVPEEQALDLLLRSVGGYLAVSRSVARAGGSRFDRIVILPGSGGESSTVRQVAPAPPLLLPPQQQVMTDGVAPAIGPNGLPAEDDQQDAPPVPAPVSPPSQNRPANAPPSSIGSPLPGMVVTPPRQGSPSTPRRR
jgi:hypothetical protein